MNILIILPNWLGDAIMATPAIELLTRYYPNANFTFVGSYVSIEALKYHPKCKKAIVDETKKAPNRFIATYKLAKELGEFDLAITFRNQLHSSLLLRFTNTVICISKQSWHSMFLLSHTPKISKKQHLVKQYSQLAMINIDTYSDEKIKNLQLYIEPKKFDKPTLGINAGATYGSAKRWHHKKFAELINKLPEEFDIILFGSPAEIEINNEIENLVKRPVLNLAGKTTIQNLAEKIAGLSFFITNDSGPLHIAGAFKIPTIAIFGSTDFHKTDQWQNPNQYIITKNLDCSPCMKRTCPLKHHNCMEQIQVNDILNIFYNIPKK